MLLNATQNKQYMTLYGLGGVGMGVNKSSLENISRFLKWNSVTGICVVCLAYYMASIHKN